MCRAAACSASTAGAEESCLSVRPGQGQPGRQGTTPLRSAIRRPEPSTSAMCARRFASIHLYHDLPHALYRHHHPQSHPYRIRRATDLPPLQTWMRLAQRSSRAPRTTGVLHGCPPLVCCRRACGEQLRAPAAAEAEAISELVHGAPGRAAPSHRATQCHAARVPHSSNAVSAAGAALCSCTARR
jgi:hypothetical protein